MASKIIPYILDACALIAFLRNEKGSEKILKLFKVNQHRIYLHAINLGEVYYDTLRISGKKKAHELFEDITILPIDVIWHLDIPFLELVGKYKTSFSLSYADAFVLALAERENGTVVTTDHGDFDTVEKTKNIRFYWLR